MPQSFTISICPSLNNNVTSGLIMDHLIVLIPSSERILLLSLKEIKPKNKMHKAELDNDK